MTSQILLTGHEMPKFLFAFFPQDCYKGFESSYLWNGKRYQQRVKSFPFGFQRYFILANKKLSKISMHKHFKNLFLVHISTYITDQVSRQCQMPWEHQENMQKRFPFLK